MGTGTPGTVAIAIRAKPQTNLPFTHPLDLNTLQHNRVANVPLFLDSPIVPVSDSPIVPGSRSLPNLPPFFLATLLTVTIQQVNNTKSTRHSHARLLIPRPRTNAAPHSVRLLPACPSVHPLRARASPPPCRNLPRSRTRLVASARRLAST